MVTFKEPAQWYNDGLSPCFICEGDSDHDIITCKGCGTQMCEDSHTPVKFRIWARFDAYSIYTGMYCQQCYDSGDATRYPYSKGEYYDPAFAGESLEPEI